MPLDKNDLKEIAKIVDTRIGKFGDHFDDKLKTTEKRIDRRFKTAEERFDASLKKTEEYLEDKIEYTVMQSEKRLENKIDIIDVRLTRVEGEIIDIADNNREFLNELSKNVEKTGDHDVRIVKLEKKAKTAV